jgi:hypothetical protein
MNDFLDLLFNPTNPNGLMLGACLGMISAGRYYGLFGRR